MYILHKLNIHFIYVAKVWSVSKNIDLSMYVCKCIRIGAGW